MDRRADFLPPIDARNPLGGVEISPTLISWQLSLMPICLGSIGAFRSIAMFDVLLTADVPKDAKLCALTASAWKAFVGDIHKDVLAVDAPLRALVSEVQEKIDERLGVEDRYLYEKEIQQHSYEVLMAMVLDADGGEMNMMRPLEDSEAWLIEYKRLGNKNV